MPSPKIALYSAVCLFALASVGFGQQPAPFFNVNADGQLLAQNSSAIDQSRLLRDASPPNTTGVNADGMALAETDAAASDDDSFGTQLILKKQERRPTITVFGGASLIYTSNAALTRSDGIDDVFAVLDAGLSWSPHLPHNLEATFGLHASLFRYNKTSELDFQNLGFGAGLAWSPPSLRGTTFFGRYDFTELLSSSGDQILMDHVLTLGAQRTFVFGRSHALNIGATAMAGFSDPSSAQRHQLGAFISYHLQLTRNLGIDLLWRPAGHFYEEAGRSDFNSVISSHLRYRLNTWAELSAFLSYGANRSDDAVFDYDAVTAGGGAALVVRF